MPSRRRALFLACAAVVSHAAFARAQLPAACVPAESVRALACAAPAASATPRTAPSAAPATAAYEPTQTLAWDARVAPDARWHREPFDATASAQQLAAVASTDSGYPHAQYALAAVAYLGGRHADAATAARNALVSTRAHATWPDAAALREASLRAFVLAYGATDPPPDAGAALTALRPVAESEDHAYELFEALARRYAQRGAWAASAAVYRALVSARPESPRRCRWQYELARAATSEQLDTGFAEVSRLVDLQTAWDAPGPNARPEADRAACRALTAGLVYELASGLDGIAAATPPTTSESREPRLQGANLAHVAPAASLYGVLFERFPALDSVAFPTLPRGAWPTRYLVSWRRANALRDAGNYAECGPAFDAVADLDPAGAFTDDALYLSVLCYEGAFQRQLGASSRRRLGRGADDRETHTPVVFTTNEALMDRAFARFVCRAPAPPLPRADGNSMAPNTVRLTVQYRRAYLHYNARHFEAAAHLFREVALSDPTTPDPENLREIAADLMLDGLNILGMHGTDGQPRAACHDALGEQMAPLRERFCAGPLRDQHDDFCARIENLQCQFLRRRAEGFFEVRRFAEAGRAYLAALQGDSSCVGVPSARPTELLYNAAVAFDAAPLRARAIRARRALVELGLPRDDVFAQRAAFALGGDYEALHFLPEAAAYYELYGRHVALHPDAARRAEADALAKATFALQRARDLRRALGEDARAREAERLLTRVRAAGSPTEAGAPLETPAHSAPNSSASPLVELTPSASYVRSRPAEPQPAWEPHSLTEATHETVDPLDYDVPLGPPAVSVTPPAPAPTTRQLRGRSVAPRPTNPPRVVHDVADTRPRPVVEYGFEVERVSASEPATLGPVFARGTRPVAIRSVVRERLGEVRACYTALLRVSPRAEGRIDLRFVVGLDGRVIAATTLPGAPRSGVEAIAPCVLGVVRRMRFEPPADPFVVTANVPLAFAP